MMMMMMKIVIMIHLCVAVNKNNYVLISNLDIMIIIIECVNIMYFKNWHKN